MTRVQPAALDPEPVAATFNHVSRRDAALEACENARMRAEAQVRDLAQEIKSLRSAADTAHQHFRRQLDGEVAKHQEVVEKLAQYESKYAFVMIGRCWFWERNEGCLVRWSSPFVTLTEIGRCCKI